MRTLIVSDLHLGARTGSDLLRRKDVLERLLEAMAGVQRVVLLGDTIELRHGPAHEVLAAARDPLSALGEAAGDAEVVLVPGNHDYGLIAPWMLRRTRDSAPRALELEQRISPHHASSLAATVADWLGAERVSVAYPGVWLGHTVYATHGHYLDCHATMPTAERLAAGMMAKLLGPAEPGLMHLERYEALLAPIYAWIDAVVQRGRGGLDGGSRRAWSALAGEGPRPPGARALARGFPLGVAALNRAGLGPLTSDLSRAELRRGGVLAMAQVVDRLGIDAEYLVFGHSHRAGPLAGDDALEWSAPGGPRLVNSGCWVYQRGFMRGLSSASPFWPGCCVVLNESDPPRLHRLLEQVPASTLSGG